MAKMTRSIEIDGGGTGESKRRIARTSHRTTLVIAMVIGVGSGRWQQCCAQTQGRYQDDVTAATGKNRLQQSYMPNP
jgi:hypothetical protein